MCAAIRPQLSLNTVNFEKYVYGFRKKTEIPMSSRSFHLAQNPFATTDREWNNSEFVTHHISKVLFQNFSNITSFTQKHTDRRSCPRRRC